jgi:hypothetical protein
MKRELRKADIPSWHGHLARENSVELAGKNEDIHGQDARATFFATRSSCEEGPEQ